MRASVGLLVLWVVSGVALADEGPTYTAPQGPVATHVAISVIQDQSEAPILVIKYPWSAHPQASVEVCLLPKDVPDSPAIRPLDLAGRLTRDKDGKLVKAVYKCQDDAASTPTAVSVTDGDLNFDILGNRNSLGSAAVAVGWKTLTPDRKAIHRSAFYRLQSWAADNDTLMLDLPPEHFCRPGTLKVWLLRGNEVVWSETVPWQESTLGPWSALAAANPESPAAEARKEKASNREKHAQRTPDRRLRRGDEARLGKGDQASLQGRRQQGRRRGRASAVRRRQRSRPRRQTRPERACRRRLVPV